MIFLLGLLAVVVMASGYAALQVGNENDNYGAVVITPEAIINYSTVNVNNSQYLQGYTPTTLGAWLAVTYGWLTSFTELDPYWTANYTANNASWSNMTNTSYVPYTGAINNVDLGNHNLTINQSIYFGNGTTQGTRLLMSYMDNATGAAINDGFRIEYLGGYELPNDDWLMFTKTDGNDPLADGGIGFRTMNKTGYNETIWSFYGDSDIRMNRSLEVRDAGNAIVSIRSGIGNDNSTLGFYETDAPRAALIYDGLTGMLNVWSLYADGADDILMTFNTRTNNITIPKGNLLVTNNINATGNITGNNLYGGMYNFSDAGYPTGIASTGVYYNITGLECGYVNGFTCDVAKGTLTAKISGVYKIDFTASLSTASANGLYGGGISKNYADLEVQKRCYSRQWIVANEPDTLAGTCLLTLAAGDTLNYQIDDEVNPVRDTYWQTIQFTVLRVGN
jgi:hypothetical protein